MVNESEERAAAYMLDMAADRFSNHGCNDHWLDNTDENWAMVVGYHEWNGDPQDTPARPAHDERIYMQDWMLMRYLAARLRGEA